MEFCHTLPGLRNSSRMLWGRGSFLILLELPNPGDCAVAIIDDNSDIYVCTCQRSITHFRVVIKADIEGAELKIIPDMVRRNAFNKLSFIYICEQSGKFLALVIKKNLLMF